jgi:hypothetical protein
MTTAALLATGVADLGAVAVELNRYALLGRAESGGLVSPGRLAASEHREVVIGLLQIPLTVATVIVFIWWFRRAYGNVDSLGGRRRFRTGWAIGGWFVPVLALWRPKQIANDLWSTSDPERPAEAVSRAGVSPLVSWWWALFLVSNWVSGRAFLGADDSTVHAMRTTAMLFLVSSVVDIAAVCLAVAVVLAITSRQERRAERRAATFWSPAMPAHHAPVPRVSR